LLNKINYFRLNSSLKIKNNKATEDIEEINGIFDNISTLCNKFSNLLEKISEVEVFGSNQKSIENQLNNLETEVYEGIEESKLLIEKTQNKYKTYQNFVPSDIARELQSLELLTEKLQGAMETKNKEYKRAKTVRTEYLTGVEEVQQWLQHAELQIQNRTLEPIKYKELLHKIFQEIGGITDRLDNVKKNGRIIIEKTRSEDEKVLIQTTIDQLTQQLSQIRAWIDEKKQQVGDTLDAWTRFLNLYQIVMSWAGEKRRFLQEPMEINTLHQARQKLNDYSVSVLN